jgi:hypothetical protein
MVLSVVTNQEDSHIRFGNSFSRSKFAKPIAAGITFSVLADNHGLNQTASLSLNLEGFELLEKITLHEDIIGLSVHAL